MADLTCLIRNLSINLCLSTAQWYLFTLTGRWRWNRGSHSGHVFYLDAILETCSPNHDKQIKSNYRISVKSSSRSIGAPSWVRCVICSFYSGAMIGQSNHKLLSKMQPFGSLPCSDLLRALITQLRASYLRFLGMMEARLSCSRIVGLQNMLYTNQIIVTNWIRVHFIRPSHEVEGIE